MVNKSIIFISLILILTSSAVFGDSIAPESGVITSSIYTSGWKCQSTYFRAYQSSTGSWSNREYCLFGCSSGNCIIKPIKITGDSTCITKTNQALTLLKNKAIVHYNIIIKFVGTIQCVNSGSGMYAWENPPRYVVGKATVNAGTIWYAGTLVHDACHSKEYHDYLLTHPGSTVPSNVYTGKSAEALCLNAQYDALVKIGATKSTLDYVKNIINSNYWNVPYSGRWW